MTPANHTPPNAVTTAEEAVAYVRYARKVSPAPYETEEASVSFPIPIPEGVGSVTSPALLAQVEEALGNAKVTVLTALDLPFVYENGAVREVTGAARPEATAPAQPQRQPQPQAQPQGVGGNGGGGTVTAIGSGGGVPKCGICGGPVWDNREGKRNPKAPDFKCRDRDACGAAMWLNDDGTEGKWKP